MKKILIVDNTFDPPHGCPEIRAHLEENAKEFGSIEVASARAPESQLPADLTGIDGVVISGSRTRILENAPWIEKEMAMIRELYAKKIPTFGICYGEQLIAKTLAGEQYVAVAKQSEHGFVEMQMSPEAAKSPLFSGLKEKFYTYEWHSDEVLPLPKGFRTLAQSTDCAVQAFEVEGAPMWGVQFHPERGLEGGKQSLDRKIARNENQKIFNREIADKVFDPSVAKSMFTNFLKQVWKIKS